jgi:hypothetical protein
MLLPFILALLTTIVVANESDDGMEIAIPKTPPSSPVNSVAKNSRIATKSLDILEAQLLIRASKDMKEATDKEESLPPRSPKGRRTSVREDQEESIEADSGDEEDIQRRTRALTSPMKSRAELAAARKSMRASDEKWSMESRLFSASKADESMCESDSRSL